jgi:hypothetical protein
MPVLHLSALLDAEILPHRLMQQRSLTDGGSCGLKKFVYGNLQIPRIAIQSQEKHRRKRADLPSKLRKLRKEAFTMISVDGDTMIPRKANTCCEWSCEGQWKVVRMPGRSMWKRIQGRPGLNDLTKPERDALVRSLRLASTEQ